MLYEFYFVVGVALVTLEKAQDYQLQAGLLLKLPRNTCPSMNCFVELETVIKPLYFLEEEMWVRVGQKRVQLFERSVVWKLSLLVNESVRLRNFQIGIDFRNGGFRFDLLFSLVVALLVFGINILVY